VVCESMLVVGILCLVVDDSAAAVSGLVVCGSLSAVAGWKDNSSTTAAFSLELLLDEAGGSVVLEPVAMVAGLVSMSVVAIISVVGISSAVIVVVGVKDVWPAESAAPESLGLGLFDEGSILALIKIKLSSQIRQ